MDQDALESAKDPKQGQTVRDIMTKWQTTFTIGKGHTKVRVDISYKRGLFQGDSLSPILFGMSILPLSHSLQQTRGYTSSYLTDKITHTLFMDDLKLFCHNRWELTQTILEANETSQAIGMELGINKCAVAQVVKGKLREGGLVSLLDGRRIRAATMEEPYKYLGVLQVFDHGAPLTRKNVIRSYVKRIHRIWSSNLNSRVRGQYQCVDITLVL